MISYYKTFECPVNVSIYHCDSKVEVIQKISKVALWKKILVFFRRENLITVYFLSSVEIWAEIGRKQKKKRKLHKKRSKYYAFGGEIFSAKFQETALKSIQELAMFWQYNTLSASHFETIFEKEDVTLSEVLEQENVIQECKTQTKKLIDLWVFVLEIVHL